MPMYNLLEYSLNYSGTTGSLFYSQDGAANLNADIENTNAFKSFKYKAKLLETQLLSLLQIKVMEF